MAASLLPSLGFFAPSPLGQGAYGQVLRCSDAHGNELAVKIATEARACAAAKREAAVMAQIPNHPNVLPLHSFTTAPSCSILAMPLATGGDTLHYMQSRGCAPMSANELHSFFSQLVDAVEHLHRNGIVHRDIKCENILLTGTEQRLMLADFGFATRFRRGSKTLTEAWGSLHYSSPEICARTAYEGPEVDVWSMGVVLFAWATGRLPFGGASDETSARIVSGTFAIPALVNEELAELIEGMLEVDAAKRLTIAGIRAHPWFAAHAHATATATAATTITAAATTAAPSVTVTQSSTEVAPSTLKRPAERLSVAFNRVFRLRK